MSDKPQGKARAKGKKARANQNRKASDVAESEDAPEEVSETTETNETAVAAESPTTDVAEVVPDFNTQTAVPATEPDVPAIVEPEVPAHVTPETEVPAIAEPEYVKPAEEEVAKVADSMKEIVNQGASIAASVTEEAAHLISTKDVESKQAIAAVTEAVATVTEELSSEGPHAIAEVAQAKEGLSSITEEARAEIAETVTKIGDAITESLVKEVAQVQAAKEVAVGAAAELLNSLNTVNEVRAAIAEDSNAGQQAAPIVEGLAKFTPPNGQEAGCCTIL